MRKFYIKINKDECFNEIEQRSSCQNICSSETGPVCRGNIHKNIIWPTIKGNDTVKLKCFPTVINKSISNLKAYRTCHILTNEIFSKWQNADISECVQKFLIKIKQDIFQFYTNDNFDENQIIGFVEQLYSLSMKFARNNPKRTIYDISTIIDSMDYLVNAQVTERF